MRLLKTVLCPLLLALLVSCGGGGGLDSEVAVRLVHAAADGPRVNLLLQGAVVRAGLDYKQGTGFLFLTAGSYDIGVQAILPGDDATIVDLPDESLVAGNQYTLVAVGKSGNDTVEALTIAHPIAEVATGNGRLEFVHAAPDAPAIDVYFTAPGDALTPAGLLGSLSFKGQLPRQEFPAGTYRIRLTPAGDTGTVLYDSGDLALRSRADLFVVVVTNTSTGTAPVSVVINDGSIQGEVPDVAAPAAIRVVHGSPDAPPLVATAERALKKQLSSPPQDPLPNPPCAYDPNLLATDPLCVAPPPASTALGGSLAFPDFTAYVDIDPGLDPPAGYDFFNTSDRYTVTVAAAATPATKLTTSAVSLARGERITVVAAGLLASIGDIVLIDDIRSVATEGRLRLVQGSPGAGLVDIYVAAPATDLATATPLLGSVSLANQTGHLGFAAGDYRVTIKKTGTDVTVPANVLVTVDVTLAAGTVQTLILRDAPGGGTPIGVILIDDRS